MYTPNNGSSCLSESTAEKLNQANPRIDGALLDYLHDEG